MSLPEATATELQIFQHMCQMATASARAHGYLTVLLAHCEVTNNVSMHAKDIRQALMVVSKLQKEISADLFDVVARNRG